MATSASVRRVVALTRQIASYKALARSGILTPQEAEIAIADCEAEISRVRSQGELPGVASATPSPAPKGAVK